MQLLLLALLTSARGAPQSHSQQLVHKGRQGRDNVGLQVQPQLVRGRLARVSALRAASARGPQAHRQLMQKGSRAPKSASVQVQLEAVPPLVWHFQGQRKKSRVLRG